MEIKINNIVQIDEVLKIAEEIFNPTPDEIEQFHQKELWLSKLDKDGLLLTANKDNKIIGFAICYRKEDSFHIWNVGVLEEYRRMGVWKEIYSGIKKYSIQNNYTKLTINTFRNKFPNMYEYLINNGFNEVKVEKGKSHFEKYL